MKELLLASAIAGIAACSDGSDSTGSAEQDTKNIRADIRAEALSASSTVLDVSLSIASDTDQKIKLENGDQLSASAGGETIQLSLKENSVKPVYVGTLSTGADSTVITVALKRTTPPSDAGIPFPSEQISKPDFDEIFIDAPNSVATLPASFTVSTPAAATEFTSALSTVPLAWTPSGSGDDMRLLYSTTCPPSPANNATSISGELVISGDTGSQAVPMIDLLSTQGTSKKCSIQLDVIREASGALDTAYRTGSIFGTQRRTVTIIYSP